MSRHCNAAQNHNKQRANASFENVAKFRYSETTVTNQFRIFCLLVAHEKIIQIKIRRTIILPVVLHG